MKKHKRTESSISLPQIFLLFTLSVLIVLPGFSQQVILNSTTHQIASPVSASTFYATNQPPASSISGLGSGVASALTNSVNGATGFIALDANSLIQTPSIKSLHGSGDSTETNGYTIVLPQPGYGLALAGDTNYNGTPGFQYPITFFGQHLVVKPPLGDTAVDMVNGIINFDGSYAPGASFDPSGHAGWRFWSCSDSNSSDNKISLDTYLRQLYDQTNGNLSIDWNTRRFYDSTGTVLPTGIIKQNSAGAWSTAVAGTDYPGLSTANTFSANQTFHDSSSYSPVIITSTQTANSNSLLFDGASTRNYIVWLDNNFNSANNYYKIGAEVSASVVDFAFYNLVSGNTPLELDHNDNAIVYGTIKSGGVQVPVFPTPQRFSPTTGSTVTISSSSTANLVAFITPSGTLATLTISMPTGGFDGQVLHLASSQILTAITFSGATTSAAATGMSTAKTGLNFVWDATASTWRQD